MDFAGQKAAEELSFVLVIATSIIAFIAGAVRLRSHVSRFAHAELIGQPLPAGYVKDDFTVLFYTFLAGSAIAALLTLPSWSWYRKHPLPWLPPLDVPAEAQQMPKAWYSFLL